MKSSFLPKKYRKNERGNVLTVFALVVGAVATIVGLVIRTAPAYITEGDLEIAVNDAAQSASAEMKYNYQLEDMQTAVQAVLQSNNIQPTMLSIQNCDTIAQAQGFDLATEAGRADAHALDPEVCTDPLRKIVRVIVTTPVEPDNHEVTMKAVAESPSLDLVLAIDTSESMTYGWNNETTGDQRDPSQCNLYNTCTPFEDAKNAASSFVSQLYFPYDRVGMVTFAKDAELILPVSDDRDEVLTALNNLKIYESNQTCPYRFEDRTDDASTYSAIPGDVVNPCRLYHSTLVNGGAYIGFDCPAAYGLTPDVAACPTTNTSDGIALSGSILEGDYSSAYSYYPVPSGGWPIARENAQPVFVLLTDSPANSGHDMNGSRLCPPAENNYNWFNSHPPCRDDNVLVRHCWSENDTFCITADYPPGTTSTVNPNLYDADDRARDMFDFVAANDTIIFTMGIGAEIKKNTVAYDVNGIAPGEALLEYGAFGTIPGFHIGAYYHSNNATELNDSFTDIISKLTNDYVFIHPTPIPTLTITPTITLTSPTQTHTITPSNTPTLTPTPTSTRTFTTSPTPTPSGTGSRTNTNTPSPTATPTKTLTLTSTSTAYPTETRTITPTVTPTSTATLPSMTFKSAGAQDGWVRESKETSNTGGALNTLGATFMLGDDVANRQYRAFLSFNTAALPDNAVIQSAILRIRYSAFVGSNPFNTFGSLWAQIKKNAFSNNPNLEPSDFNAAPSSTLSAGTFTGPVNAWYSAKLTSVGRANLNRTGLTQFRLRFALDDNNNNTADYMRFMSGSVSYPPELVVTYIIP